MNGNLTVRLNSAIYPACRARRRLVLNRLTTLALSVAFLALTAPALADEDVKTEVDARAAYSRLQREVDSFVRQWRYNLDNHYNRKTTSSETMTASTNTLWAQLVHFPDSVCRTKSDSLEIVRYVRDEAERKGIRLDAPSSGTIAMYQIDGSSVDCKNHRMTGRINFRNVRFTTVTVH
jgi:hypothetical protein